MESVRQSVSGPMPGQPVSQSAPSVTIAASCSTLEMFTRSSSEGMSQYFSSSVSRSYSGR